MEFDGNSLLWIQENLRTPLLTEVFTWLTHLGDGGRVWILLAVLLLCFKRTRRAGMTAILALMFSFVITNLCLKNVIARTRPYEALEGLIPLLSKQGGYSFPSGHTSSSFAAAAAISKRVPRKYHIAIIGLAIWIALSRLYVGVHYPTDVAGGIAAGILSARLAEKVLSVLDVWKNKIQPKETVSGMRNTKSSRK